MFIKSSKKKNMQQSALATMQDVAHYAGVSQSTVSRVLNQSSSTIPISGETRQKILDAVTALGYHPNMTARSLRTQRTHLIAIMIADITNAFYHAITRTVQDIAIRHDYDVLIANTDHIYEYEKRFCNSVMRRPVDGIIMVPYHLTDMEIGNLIERTGASVVALSESLEHPAVDLVSGNDRPATYRAVRLLAEKYQRIAFIGLTPDMPPGVRRQQAYVQALADAGLSVPPEYIQQGDWTYESGKCAMETLLRLPEPPQAVFVCNDTMAIGAVNAAQELGRRVPEEVAVMGFDNIPAATLIRPTLSTVAQFPVEIGRALAEMLFERIEGIYRGPQRVVEVPCQLIERQST